MTCEASEFWHNWDEAAYKTDIIIKVGVKQDRVYLPQELNLCLYPLYKGASPCPSSLLMKRKMLIDKGGFEKEFTGQYQLYEDQAFLTKIYLEEKVYVSSSCNNRYRQRTGSLVQSVKAAGNYNAVRKFYLVWLQTYLQEKNIKNRQIDKLIKRAWYPYKAPFLFYLTDVIPHKLKSLIYKIVKV
ncbi:MAG TPA: hypothetical protein VGO09_06090 [Flavisolibacter sp.]|nr:hypothetical protein [Flavisolibacter sp.]